MYANATPGFKRGCGERVEEGVYACCGFSPYGKPVEHFLKDPPTKLSLHALGISARGVTLQQDREGTWHIIDWVGANNYPNVADFVEEVRRAGLSRRLPANLDFAKLEAGKSRHILIHPNAYIENFAQVYKAIRWEGDCPKEIPDHEVFWNEDDQKMPTEMCAGLHWESVLGGEPVPGCTYRVVKRVMPGFNYEARRLPEGVEARYSPAVFAVFPITALTVIRSKSGGHKANVARAKKSSIPVVEEDA